MRVAYAGSPDAAVPPLRALAGLVPRGGARRHPARQAARPLRPAQPAPRWRRPPRSSASRRCARATINDPEVVEEHRRRRRRGARGRRLRADPARRGPVALALRERPLLAAARLPRRGAGGAGGDGRGRRDRRDHDVHGGGPRHRPDPAGGADPGRRGRGGRRAARAPARTSARRCWCGRSTRSEAGTLEPRVQPEEGVSFAPEDRPGGPRAGPAPPGRRARAARAGAGPAHRRHRRHRRRSPSRSGARGRCPSRCRRGCRWRRGACSPARGRGRSRSPRLQPPGKGRMDAADFLRGYRGPLAWAAA